MSFFGRKKDSPVKTEEKKTPITRKQLGILVLVVIVISIIINFSFKNFFLGRESSPVRVPTWIFVIAAGFVFYIIIYFAWRTKNFFVEWVLSFIYGVLIMLLLIAFQYQEWLGLIENETVKIALGSLIVGGGSVGLGAIIKVLFKPLYTILKKSYFWEAKR